jgi:DNA polymerase-1
MAPPPTLYLIDGYAQFFRAYHAIRTPMSSPVTREPTNMSFGFIGMLLKLLRGEGKVGQDGGRADYVAVAIDVSGDKETFRSEIYPDYKAHRPPPPPDLFPQVDRCLNVLRQIGVPVVGAEGFEADDAIATLVARLRQEHPDLRIRIISKDKDLKQLLSPPAGSASAGAPVEMYDIHTDALITADTLKEETGLTPAQVVDMLALMGDTTDNVPGVEGVGPKTAAELIATYGSLENLIAHAGEIKGKRGEKLRQAIPLLGLSRQLVTLRRDAPVSLDLAQADTRRFRLEALLPVLRELGFNRYQDEVRELLARRAGTPAATPPPAAGDGALGRSNGHGRAPAPASTGADSPATFGASLFDHLEPSGAPPSPGDRVSDRPPNPEYRAITSKAALDQLLADLRRAEVVSLDTETTSLVPREARLCGLSLSITPGSGWYIPVRSPAPGTHLDERTVLDALRPILEDPAVPKCGHNLKFDILILRAAGVDLAGLCPPPPVLRAGAPGGAGRGGPADGDAPIGGDSLVASFLIDPSRSSHSLDALALAILNHTNIPIRELIGSGPSQRTFDTVPLDLATQYAAEDADIALRLRQAMHPQLRAMGLMPLYRDVELPLVEVLAELEWNGVLVDPVELDRQRDRLLGQIRAIRERIDDAAMAALGRTFNPDSPRQLVAVLFNKPDAAEPGLGLRPAKRTKTGYSTDTEVLEALAADPAVASPIPQLILDYRQLTKLVSTYLVALRAAISPVTGRIHASFNQTGAITGRLSSSDPNLQNIPIRTDVGREIRRAFIAPPRRVLISADYSQIELRLLAHLARDPALADAFHRGEDIHTAVAAQVFGVSLDQVSREQRDSAKMVNFGIVYGVTPFGLARRLGISTDAAAEIITSYKRRFAGITTFLQECVEHARRFGYVETMLRRRRPISGLDDPNPARRALAERLAINSVVQGSAADLIKLAMIDLHGRLSEHAGHWRAAAVDAAGSVHSQGPSTSRAAVPTIPDPGVGPHRSWPPPAFPGVKMILQIHDELVFEAPAGIAEDARRLIVERMEHAMELSVPLKVDSAISANWFEG